MRKIMKVMESGGAGGFSADAAAVAVAVAMVAMVGAVIRLWICMPQRMGGRWAARGLGLLEAVPKTESSGRGGGRRSARRKTRSASRTRLGKSSGSERAGVCTLIVLGSGGHTAEMLKLIEGLDPARYSPMHVVVAESDKRSAEKAISWAGERKLVIHKITRSREVGQGWVSTVLTTIQSFYHCFVIVMRAKPQVVITNGPGTCLPIVYSAFFLRLLGTGHSRLIIFVESFARVKTLSLTGKLVFPIVDHFIVQWETLAQLYPRTRYLGPLF
eukprot:g5426.t1